MKPHFHQPLFMRDVKIPFDMKTKTFELPFRIAEFVDKDKRRPWPGIRFFGQIDRISETFMHLCFALGILGFRMDRKCLDSLSQIYAPFEQELFHILPLVF